MSVDSTPPRLYPLFADLRDRAVLVVGGGAVALRKAEALLAAGASVRLGAPTLVPGLRALAASRRIVHVAGRFEPCWLDPVFLVVAATGDAVVNRAVADAARERRLLVNVVDDAELSSFHVPARVERGALQVAISSGGGAPMLARRLREQLERQLDESLGPLADLLTRQRERIRARWPGLAARRRWFERLLSGPLPGLLRRGDRAAAGRAFEHALSIDLAPDATGSVALVGAGPGDPGLLTLRALRLLNEADVILHDRLVGDAVLQLARRDAERIAVGKQPGRHAISQARINVLLVEHARLGKRVVRLKGGDPFVFGRGGEELEHLRAHGIAYEVAPGITAALACAAYAGIPLTHRDHAHSLRLVTAHCKDSLDTIDWPALAQERQTLAVYMGVAALETVCARLIDHGVDASTPFALIENGTRTDQRVVTGPLSELAVRARAHGVRAPALLVIGEVAAFADTLAWFGAAPLGMPVAPVLEQAA